MGKQHLRQESPGRDGCPGLGERPAVCPAASLHPLLGPLGFRLEQEEACAQEAELGQKQPLNLQSARVKVRPRKGKRAGIGAG